MASTARELRKKLRASGLRAPYTLEQVENGGGRMNLTRCYLRASTDAQDATRARSPGRGCSPPTMASPSPGWFIENESGAKLAASRTVSAPGRQQAGRYPAD